MKYLVNSSPLKKNKRLLSYSFSNTDKLKLNKIQSFVYPMTLISFLNRDSYTSYFYMWRYQNSIKTVLWDFLVKKKMKTTTKLLKSIRRVSNITFISRFINFLTKKGLKTKYTNILSVSISRLYFTFFFFNKTLSGENKYYKDMFLIIPNFLNFYDFKSIINFFTTILEPFFYMRVKRVEKKYRKKLKKKFTIQPIYVKPIKRNSFVLRSLISYTNLFSSYSLSERLFLSLFKSLTEQKQSFLYRRKLYMYTRLFTNNQRKVF